VTVAVLGPLLHLTRFLLGADLGLFLTEGASLNTLTTSLQLPLLTATSLLGRLGAQALTNVGLAGLVGYYTC